MKLLAGSMMLPVALLMPRVAGADSILFTNTGAGADGVTLNASALFDISGTALTITLSNLGDTSGSGQDVPGNGLTGLFFDLPDNFTLTPVSATIAAGALLQGSLCTVGPCNSSTTNVGGEFRYDTGAFPNSADRGIASAGYIGGGPTFNGPNLDNPLSVNGISFGIIAPVTSSNPFNPNGGMLQPVIESTVQFTMSIAGDQQLTAADFANVSFQYGTDFSEPNIGGPGDSVPEPAGTLLTLVGLAAAVRRVSQKRHRRR